MMARVVASSTLIRTNPVGIINSTSGYANALIQARLI